MRKAENSIDKIDQFCYNVSKLTKRGVVMPSEREVGFQINMVSNLIKRRLHLSGNELEQDHVTSMQGRVIGYLYENRDRDVFQRDLEAEFSVRRSTVTGILQLMEKNQLICRESVSYDARLKKLTLTEKAVAFHQEFIKEIQKVEKQLTRGLTEQEIDTFFILIEKIKQNLQS